MRRRWGSSDGRPHSYGPTPNPSPLRREGNRAPLPAKRGEAGGWGIFLRIIAKPDDPRGNAGHDEPG